MDHYDIDGNPISLRKWAESLGNVESRRIGLDVFDVWTVSTVWLGLDYNFGEGPPLIFETMVFQEGKSAGDPEYTARYSTKEEALAGHLRTVAIYRAVVQVQQM